MGIIKAKAKKKKHKKKEGENFIMEKAIINQKEAQKGITLIALVITIIVLLILAGVSIAMLTGQNGILTQANNAKNATELASAKEKVELAVIGAISQTRDGTLTVGKLRTELANYGGTIEGDTFPVTAKVDGKSFTVDANGNVTVSGSSTEPNPPAPTENGTLGTVTGSEKTNTTVKDSLGNQVVVPAGFKVVNKDANVTDGIVVEDVSHSATAGSQFVWIPVGEVVKEIKDGVKSTETIKLSRYTFAEDNVGTPTDQGTKNINGYKNAKFTEVNTSTYGNKTAKENIESEESGFRKSAKDNHGYYIGRYESRTSTERKSETDKLTQITVKPDEYVYNYTTQLQAAELSRGMYSDSNFESDLMNSYAWDTAIVFLQKFDNRTNKASLKPYSQQKSLNTKSDGLASQGTNNLRDASKQDVICNVYDMASNCVEWTTETYTNSSLPCTGRGGGYFFSDFYTSIRGGTSISNSGDDVSFRPLLYM